jgi:hypothetical protein
MAFAFEKLQVYQKAVDFADTIASQTESLPRDDVSFRFQRQKFSDESKGASV